MIQRGCVVGSLPVLVRLNGSAYIFSAKIGDKDEKNEQQTK